MNRSHIAINAGLNRVNVSFGDCYIFNLDEESLYLVQVCYIFNLDEESLYLVQVCLIQQVQRLMHYQVVGYLILHLNLIFVCYAQIIGCAVLMLVYQRVL